MIGIVPQHALDAAAVSLVRVITGDEPMVTSGSLLDMPEGDPGTATWWSGKQALPYPRGTLVGYSLSETHTASVRETFAGATTDSVQVDYEMAHLEAAAQAGDETAFLSAEKAIDWSRRSAEDFIHAVQLALAAGAYLRARTLATLGATRFPSQAELQKYARVLAPPKVSRGKRSSSSGWKANRDWLVSHGESYRGRWVALRDGELVGSASTLKALSAQLPSTTGLLITKVY